MIVSFPQSRDRHLANTRNTIGRTKRVLLAGKLMIRPFDSRFSKLKELILKHREWFEREAIISQHELVSDTFSELREFVTKKDRDTPEEERKLKMENGECWI